MSNVNYLVNELRDADAWIDDRNHYNGGFGWRGDRPLSAVKYVALHHSVTKPTGNGRQEVDAVARAHLNGRGWGGIGYNIIITTEEKNGYAVAHYVGDLGSIRAHTPNRKGVFGIPPRQGNYYIIAICLIGELHLHRPTDAQIRTVHEIVKDMIFDEDVRLPQLATWDNMKGHKDFDPTACPGDFAYREDIINFVSPEPPVEPEPETSTQPEAEPEPEVTVINSRTNPVVDPPKKNTSFFDIIWELIDVLFKSLSRKK